MLVNNRPLFESRPPSPFLAMRDRRFGLGAAAASTTSGEISTIGSSVASTGAALLPILYGSLAAVPVVGWIAAGALAVGSVIVGALGVGNGCGGSCIQASNDANQIEVQMRANLAAYQAGQISQAEALSVFDQLWSALEQACMGVGGAAGQNCIGDRQAGACKWKDASGQCWNWFVGYRDPISHGTVSTSAASGLNLQSILLLGGAALLVAEVL
jgi:hypothetical protein